MKIALPELSLVVLIGASSSGKSTFAAKHFKATEVISSDACRALVADDVNDLSATPAAFEVLHFIAGRRLVAGRLTVIDATNVQEDARRPLVALARDHHCLPVAIVFHLPVRTLKDRNRARTDRTIPSGAIDRQADQLRRSLAHLSKEGFTAVHVLTSPDEIETIEIDRVRLWSDRRDDHGPFDVIGDVHGCLDELLALLQSLGYVVTTRTDTGEADRYTITPPDGRKAIFIGDLVDRGPQITGVLRLVMSMVASGAALCLPGNHDAKLVRALKGRRVQVTHGLEHSLEQLAGESSAAKEEFVRFLDGLVSHFVLDGGRLVVAHAGMKQEMQGRASRAVREFALYGETTGETDEFGLPVRFNWAEEYRGRALVVYGHTPVAEPVWQNDTVNIDTGCVFGGRLTALRYPERELVSVHAARTYYAPQRPPLSAPTPPPAELLDVSDIAGRRRIETRLIGDVSISEEQAKAAVEVMSRFAIDPRWLIYLPPTMSPTETTARPGLLEHPEEACAYYARHHLTQVVAEEKHMGSRAVIIVCRSAEAASRTFRAHDGRPGVCYTRTGRPFFDEPAMEAALLQRVSMAVEDAGLWAELDADWVCLDCEIMPWSAKAEELIKDQYAGVGTAAQIAFRRGLAALDQAAVRGLEVQPLLEQMKERLELSERYVRAYRAYVWPVHSLGDLRVAPFCLLASGRTMHTDKTHLWHMAIARRLAAADAERHGDDPVLLATSHKLVDLGDADQREEAFRWWDDLTAAGGEGFVVKPVEYAAREARGLLQPGLKSRGREYLRIIYGPEYDRPENLDRLRRRSVGRKRSLAVREFALGLEGLSRFVEGAPAYRVHECVVGVLALESEPIDPRL